MHMPAVSQWFLYVSFLNGARWHTFSFGIPGVAVQCLACWWQAARFQNYSDIVIVIGGSSQDQACPSNSCCSKEFFESLRQVYKDGEITVAQVSGPNSLPRSVVMNRNMKKPSQLHFCKGWNHLHELRSHWLVGSLASEKSPLGQSPGWRHGRHWRHGGHGHCCLGLPLARSSQAYLYLLDTVTVGVGFPEKFEGLVHCPSLSWKENSGKTCSGNRGDHMKPLGFASPRSIWHFASFICEVNRVGYEEYRAPPIPPLGQKHHSIEGDGDFNMVLSKKDEKTWKKPKKNRFIIFPSHVPYVSICPIIHLLIMMFP